MSLINILIISLLIIASAARSHQYCYPAELENGIVEIIEHRQYKFSCKYGYSLEGQAYVDCTEYYRVYQRPKCIKSTEIHPYCHTYSPNLEHGFVEIAQEKYYKFSCKDSYVLEGKTYIECTHYHQTTASQMPKCTKYACEDPLNPQNGKVECDKGPLVPGRNCRFSCFKGYKLQGSNTTICKFNLQWSGSAECIAVTTTTCPSPPAPENGMVDCDEGDLTPGKSCRFSCLEGYKLQGSSVRNCMFDYRWSGYVKCKPDAEDSHSEYADGNSRIHEKINRPISNYVKNNNPSSELVNNDPCNNLQCEQLCVFQEGVYRCRCCAGYIIRPDNRTCAENKPENINMKDCLRQQQKRYRPGSHVEIHPCPEGYTFNYNSRRCTEKSVRIPAVPRPIASLQTCAVKNGGCQHSCTMKDSRTVVCGCRNGYKLLPNGKHCIDINECSVDNFGCSHSCVNVPGSAYCTCPEGFTVDVDKKTCIDIDECSLGENRCQHYCTNTPGSYFCHCKPTYILIEGRKCEGCRKNSYWSYERNACVDCPKNAHTDSEGKTSIKDCECDSGFAGNPGDYLTCEDIDECSTNNFDCSHACVNIPGSAYCICPKGFMLDTDNKTCIDIDECRIKNGGCEGLCRNTNGSFECMCLKGFVASDRDRYSCDDINECSENNGGCEHLCINYRGGFYCACEAGSRLDSNLKNCSDIHCPKLRVPHNSYMNCTHKNVPLPERDSYPSGTQCSFKCDKGFKNSQEYNKMKCKKNGNWKGMLPECKPESCPPLKVPENGKIHPPSCSVYGATVKQKCAFTCHPGYILDGSAIFECKNNLTWNKKDDIPVCKLVKVQPIIKCPEDIKVILLEGKATYNITVSEPITNMEYYDVHPSWVTINQPTEFPVGVTHITFTANSTFNETTQCEMTVTVLDEEAPIFHSCPDPIVIEGAKGSGEFVSWEEPVVTDNVELVSLFSVLEPNTTLAPGTYFVEYIARDSSGNIGTCSFDISIIRMNCTDLSDPSHGKANCMDWTFGKLCNPECEDGYIRNPEEPLYYSCDDTGLWEPNDSITDCLKYAVANSSTCEDGFVLKRVDLHGEVEVCIECPSNAVWSPLTKTCVK